MVNRIVNAGPRVFEDAAARAKYDRSQFITASGAVKRVDLTKPRRRNAGQGRRTHSRARSSSRVSSASHSTLPQGQLTIGDVRKISEGGVYFSPRTLAAHQRQHPDVEAERHTDGSDPSPERPQDRSGSAAGVGEGGTFLTQGVEVVSPSTRESRGVMPKGTPHPAATEAQSRGRTRIVERYKPWRQNMASPQTSQRGGASAAHRRGGSHFDLDNASHSEYTRSGSTSARTPGGGRRSPRRTVRRAGDSHAATQSARDPPSRHRGGGDMSPARKEYKDRSYSRPWAAGSPPRQRRELNPPPEGFLQRSPPRFPARGGAGGGSPRRARSTSPRSRQEITKAWIEKKKAPPRKPGFGGSSARGGMFGTRGDPSITKSPLKDAGAGQVSTERNYAKPWLGSRVSPVDVGRRGGSPRKAGASPARVGGAGGTGVDLTRFTRPSPGRNSGKHSTRRGPSTARVTPIDVRRAIGLSAAGSTSLQGGEGGEGGLVRQGSLTIAALLGSGGRTSPRGGSSRLDHASMY